MKKSELAVRHMDSILDELQDHFEQIRRRAFELFEARGGMFGGELDDWLAAEGEISLEPAIEVRRADGRFEIDAALPGVDAKDVDVQVTSEDVLIRAKREDVKAEPAPAAGKTEKTENARMEGLAEFYRAVHLPMPINPDAVKADYRHGMLHITMPIVEPVARRIEIHA